ncbi:MAG: hypothetical protein KGI52_14075 [Burkholderiales bacterium]|nr:hypothetical protein [Burkholderiales bacterium]
MTPTQLMAIRTLYNAGRSIDNIVRALGLSPAQAREVRDYLGATRPQPAQPPIL